MIQIIEILFVLLAIVLGVYGVLVNHHLRNKYAQAFLNSFFYYQILWLFFGLYGIMGSILIRKILLKLDVTSMNIEVISQVIPFIGIPFLIVAWFMLIKMVSELTHKKKLPYLTSAYFVLVIGAFLAYGLVINKIPELGIEWHLVSKKIFYYGFISIDLLIASYLWGALLWQSYKSKNTNKVFFVKFGTSMFVFTLIRAMGLFFHEVHALIGLYFLILFFVSNLGLIFIIRTSGKNLLVQIESVKTEIFEQYNITPREKEVIIEICKGKTNQQIADTLFITLQTVKDHTSNIYRKTTVKNRVQLSQLFAKT